MAEMIFIWAARRRDANITQQGLWSQIERLKSAGTATPVCGSILKSVNPLLTLECQKSLSLRV